MALIYQIQIRTATAVQWSTTNPVLSLGEPAYVSDTRQEKIGDGVTAWNSLPYVVSSSGGLIPNGSTGSPKLITAFGGITPTTNLRELQFIAGNGTPITITATTPIGPGTNIGQELILQGCSDTNTVTFDSGTGLSMNGPIVMGLTGAGASLYLVWNGTTWNEVSRR
jgi:hypothetical protein